jgi:hypothetical protein
MLMKMTKIIFRARSLRREPRPVAKSVVLALPQQLQNEKGHLPEIRMFRVWTLVPLPTWQSATQRKRKRTQAKERQSGQDSEDGKAGGEEDEGGGGEVVTEVRQENAIHVVKMIFPHRKRLCAARRHGSVRGAKVMPGERNVAQNMFRQRFWGLNPGGRRSLRMPHHHQLCLTTLPLSRAQKQNLCAEKAVRARSRSWKLPMYVHALWQPPHISQNLRPWVSQQQQLRVSRNGRGSQQWVR